MLAITPLSIAVIVGHCTTQYRCYCWPLHHSVLLLLLAMTSLGIAVIVGHDTTHCIAVIVGHDITHCIAVIVFLSGAAVVFIDTPSQALCPGAFILQHRPKKVFVETALTPEHGSVTGGCLTLPGAGGGVGAWGGGGGMAGCG